MVSMFTTPFINLPSICHFLQRWMWIVVSMVFNLLELIKTPLKILILTHTNVFCLSCLNFWAQGCINNLFLEISCVSRRNTRGNWFNLFWRYYISLHSGQDSWLIFRCSRSWRGRSRLWCWWWFGKFYSGYFNEVFLENIQFFLNLNILKKM